MTGHADEKRRDSAHKTHEMTRKEEIMELIYKDDRYPIVDIRLRNFGVFSCVLWAN